MASSSVPLKKGSFESHPQIFTRGKGRPEAAGETFSIFKLKAGLDMQGEDRCVMLHTQT